MSEKKRKTTYWILKVLSVLISCGLPIYAVCEHFPLWTVSYGSSRTVGAGLIISLIVIVVVFRKSVFQFMRDKMNLQHAPPLAVWLIMLVVSYILLYINQFIRDLTTVFWFGLVGCAIGTAMTFVAETFFAKKKKEERDG
jgi:hypothetical protein